MRLRMGVMLTVIAIASIVLITIKVPAYANNQTNKGKSISIKKAVPQRTIKSISDISITIKHKEIFNLPQNIPVLYNDNKKGMLTVTWNVKKVNTSLIGDFDFIGNVKGYKRRVKLHVKIKDYIKSINNLQFEVKQNDDFDLPDQVEANMSFGNKRNVDVKWSNENINTKKCGPILISGHIDGYDGIVKMNLNVVNYIISVDDINVTVNQNDNFILPLTVTTNMSDSSTLQSTVMWDKEVNTKTVGTFIYSGTIVGYNSSIKLRLTVQPYIVYVKDISVNLEYNSPFEFPNVVDVTYSDNTTKKAGVKWETNYLNTCTSGTQTLYGKVDGYNEKAKLLINIGKDLSDVYNTGTTYYYADFKTRIADGIYWVPVNILGKPTITKEEILKLERDPIKLQERLKTLYDVILYIQTVNMKTVDGNLRQNVNGISWEIPRSPEYSIAHNESNCLGISNLANYLLKGDYDEVGIMEYCEQFGGHIFNYIKQNGKYYFIDLTSYKTDFLYSAKETGNYIDHENGNVVANLHESDNFSDFVNYYMAAAKKTTLIFLSYSCNNALPIGTVFNNNYPIYYLPADGNINIIYDNPNDNISLKLIDNPNITTTY